MMPMKKPNQKGHQVQVDLRDAETVKCKKCNNYLWIQSFVLKKISALMSPTGQEGIVPIQVYACGNCGEVGEGMLDEEIE